MAKSLRIVDDVNHLSSFFCPNFPLWSEDGAQGICTPGKQLYFYNISSVSKCFLIWAIVLPSRYCGFMKRQFLSAVFELRLEEFLIWKITFGKA